VERAVLAHGRCDGRAADPADRGRRGAWCLREELWLPDDVDPIGAITIGHRAQDTGNRGSPRTRKRKSVEDVAHRGRWGGTWPSAPTDD
jgi:hypothetical protein